MEQKLSLQQSINNHLKTDSYSRAVSLKILENNFDDITIAEDGIEGYIIYSKNKKSDDKKFDLIISDINFPHLNGIQMLERIRRYDDIPFIFLTTDNNTKTVIKAVRLHILSYIIRTLSFDKIYDIINKSCEKSYTDYIIKENQKETYA